MRVTLLRLLEALAREIDFPEPVYEFGSFRVPGQRHLPEVRSFFPGRKYVGCDLQPGPGVDEIQDLHRLSLPESSVGTALLFDTIEHVRDPFLALSQVYRCLEPGGIAVMSSHWYFPIHAYPDDYWRFTASAFRELFRDYEPISIEMFGMARLPHTVLGIASRGAVDPRTRETLQRVVARWGEHDASSWKEFAMEFLPPRLLIPAYGRFLKIQEALHRDRSARS